MRLCPLIAVMSLLAFAGLVKLSGNDLFARLGQLAIWSFGLTDTSLFFAAASLASAKTGDTPQRALGFDSGHHGSADCDCQADLLSLAFGLLMRWRKNLYSLIFFHFLAYMAFSAIIGGVLARWH